MQNSCRAEGALGCLEVSGGQDARQLGTQVARLHVEQHGNLNGNTDHVCEGGFDTPLDRHCNRPRHLAGGLMANDEMKWWVSNLYSMTPLKFLHIMCYKQNRGKRWILRSPPCLVPQKLSQSRDKATQTRRTRIAIWLAHNCKKSDVGCPCTVQ